MNWRLLLAAAGTAAFALGQRFEVASIKLHPGIGNLVHIQPLPGGRLEVENFSLRLLIRTAYNVGDAQITGGPAWIGVDRYDIQAKAEGNASGKETTGPMLRALLEDRFKLVVHRETRQLPVYELTVAKGGAKLHHTTDGSCIPHSLDSMPPPPLASGQPLPKFCGFAGFGVEGINRKLEMAGISMAELAASLSGSELHTKVIDKTGLAGAFDVRVVWSLDIPSPPADSAANQAGPSLFTALPEQLGLRLEPAKGPVEVLVIDQVERPSGN